MENHQVDFGMRFFSNTGVPNIQGVHKSAMNISHEELETPSTFEYRYWKQS